MSWIDFLIQKLRFDFCIDVFAGITATILIMLVISLGAYIRGSIRWIINLLWYIVRWRKYVLIWGESLTQDGPYSAPSH